ncbi:MAG: VCBS repeat-containing protein [Cyclobacteriaceae bacterium]
MKNIELILLIIILISCKPKAEQDLIWPIHHINKTFKIANSLSPGDVNKDGFTDFAVIDESLHLFTIVLHPGDVEKIKSPWPTTVVLSATNPEYSYLGDIDGDGNLDLIGVEGDDNQKGFETGVRVMWGPEPDLANDPDAWVDGGYFPGTEDRQYLYIETHDINLDGHLDIVVGGRKHPVNGNYAGLFWLEAPPDNKRDLALWIRHYIDSTLLSGHGFVYTDFDQDGDADFVIGNADWDTKDEEEAIYWYENPGLGKDIYDQWQQHLIHKNPEYYAKPQMAIGDLNNDGLVDLVTQTKRAVYYFQKTSNDPVTFEVVEIIKPEITQWLTRGNKLVDLNGDGKMDIVGMLIHDDGNLPEGKASVFWMEYEGDKPGSDNWKTHVIKWSHGVNSGDRWIGEKWDHCRFYDLDQDGDLDIVANAEEFYKKLPDGKHDSYLSVVWFENPVK